MTISYLNTHRGLNIIMLAWLTSWPILAQEPAKASLTEAVYSLWETMGVEQMSEKGDWVSYRLSYASGGDSVFVMNTQTMKKTAFAHAKDWRFISEHLFAFKNKKGLVLFDLGTGKVKEFSDVGNYDFSSDKQFLVTFEKGSRLVIRKNENVIDQIENVTGYGWNEEKNKLIFSTSKDSVGAVGYITLQKNYSKRTIIKQLTQTFDVFNWQPNGNSVAFYGIDKGEERLYVYDFSAAILRVLEESATHFPEKMRIEPNQNISLRVSNDGKRIFFGLTSIQAKDTTLYSAGVEIWHANDQKIFRDRKLTSTVTHPQYLAVWNLENDSIIQLTNDKQTWVALTGNQTFALVADPWQYEPKNKWLSDMDFYLMDVKTGKSELLFQQQSGYPSQLDFSTDGCFISYYSDANWWVYDIKNKLSTNITKDINVNWDNRGHDPGNELRVFGQAGWTKDGKFLLLYDKYDIWAISTDGKLKRRLTNGKEKQLRFRFDTSAISSNPKFNYSELDATIIDISKKVVLSAVNLYSGATGYYQLRPEQQAEELIMKNALINKMQQAGYSDAFIYVQQRFDSPPTLMYQKGNRKETLVQSNQQHNNYQWGKAEMFHYTDSKGTLLNGVLYYPPNYDATKKYPMIVYIYESLSHLLHRYINPTLYEGIGFNVSNLSSEGYVVLMPDIAYERGNTGISATDCVTSAVQKVIAMGVADATKIALYGQSFGGYETNFIITQTNLFAAAISGNGIADIIAHYFTIHAEDNAIDAWRYENQQFRMGYSFFENQEAYYRNSPLQNAGKINTPLLTWAGKEDVNVQPTQTEALYAALRRLKKKHIMLVYENEGHILFTPRNQKDLTLKMKDWFAYYLKGEAKTEWMKKVGE